MTRSFRDHPASIARRIAARQLRAAVKELRRLSAEPEADEGPNWLDLTPDSTVEEIEVAWRATFGEAVPVEPQGTPPSREALAIHGCPLRPEWRRWDMFNAPRYQVVPEDAQPAVDAARRAEPVRHLGLVPLAWEIADDDAAYAPMTTAESGEPEWRWDKGSPRHLHAETELDGRRVHIDWTHARKHGPGRTITEIRLYVDGRLAGRGGRCGSSLGAGGSDLPAVALIGDGKAVSVDDVSGGELREGVLPQLVVELWEVRSNPDQP